MIVVRADASTDIGTGHVMRCLALGQALRQVGYLVTFLLVNSVPALEIRLREAGMHVMHLLVKPGSVEDATQTVTVAQQLNAAWVVVDGYQFDAQYQRILKQAGLKVLFLDDYGHAADYAADLVLNQNLSADPVLYCHRESYTELLLGCSYCLLRQEFWVWRDWQRQIPWVGRRILVTLGGSDPDNVTLTVMQALQRVDIEGLELVVVVGGSNPHDESLQGFAQTMSWPIRLVRNASNMPELMAWADLAIAAGGSTNWELALMGLPTVVITLAANQREIAHQLDQMGVVVHLGWYREKTEQAIAAMVSQLMLAPELRQSMSDAGKKLVDGYGSQRVVAKMQLLNS